MIVSLVGGLALVVNTSAASDARIDRWNLRADSASCVLERQVIDPPATLSVETTPGIDHYSVAIIANDIGRVGSVVPASLTFGPSGTTLNGRASVASLPGATQRVIRMDGVPPPLLDEFSKATSVTLATNSGATASIRTANAAKAVDALRLCIADQLIEWGADAGQFARGGTMPVALKNRDSWLSDKEFLEMASRSRKSDVRATFRVAISPAGVIDSCSPVDAATEEGVERIACAAVMSKTLFTPARDDDGRPVRGAASFRVLLARASR